LKFDNILNTCNKNLGNAQLQRQTLCEKSRSTLNSDDGGQCIVSGGLCVGVLPFPWGEWKKAVTPINTQARPGN